MYIYIYVYINNHSDPCKHHAAARGPWGPDIARLGMVCISRFGFLFFSFRSQDDFLAEIAVSQNTGLPQASQNTYQQLPNPATKSRSWLSILMRNDAQLNMFSYMLFESIQISGQNCITTLPPAKLH